MELLCMVYYWISHSMSFANLTLFIVIIIVSSFSSLLGEASMFQPNYVNTGIGSTYTICLKRRMQGMVTE